MDTQVKNEWWTDYAEIETIKETCEVSESIGEPT